MAPKIFPKLICGFSALALAACSSLSPPRNLEPVAEGRGYQAQYRTPPPRAPEPLYLRAEEMNAADCLPYRGGVLSGGAKFAAGVPQVLRGERLSRNDLVAIRVGEDEVFNGAYVVSRDGALKLPFLGPIRAQGRTTGAIETDLVAGLLRAGLYSEAPLVSVRVTDFASISVGVSGAVFEPRALEIGAVAAESLDRARQEALGASTEGRNLSAAIRAAGGIRPDADLSAVEVRRGGSVYRVDMRGVFEGRHVGDVMLLADDEVVVPSRNCFQDDLMRPSPVSPPGVTLFLSNLTQPATANAPSAIGREVREVPYGTRHMQAVVDTNCVGGARSTSANRSAVLFTRNPVSGVSTVIERDIEDMLRRPDRDDYDPYVLPGDSIACYDSTVTNIAEIGRVLGIVVPAAILVR
ncbi:polysaccharide biosynthesis/export family protein [Roseivivax sp. GX 12232]|uniref:polysaccharide biosynthesis/export family protein n=1 Tax=Roseivivax sp. GX 12232 TaxID=2900547 RepID=UPI001E3F930D|nr:polysaccharide biosynthesis/export family protein [Roseivivax sp. GX 12232]MCE0506449.1 polysaccharide biosynthesis/export family protein [Roseivivax sp. GX 12232]